MNRPLVVGFLIKKEGKTYRRKKIYRKSKENLSLHLKLDFIYVYSNLITYRIRYLIQPEKYLQMIW